VSDNGQFITSSGNKLLVKSNSSGGLDAYYMNGTTSVTVLSLTLSDNDYKMQLFKPLDGAAGFDLNSSSVIGGGNINAVWVAQLTPGINSVDQYYDPVTKLVKAGYENQIIAYGTAKTTSGAVQSVNTNDKEWGVGSGQDINSTQILTIEFTTASEWTLGSRSGNTYSLNSAADLTNPQLIGLQLTLSKLDGGTVNPEDVYFSLIKQDPGADVTVATGKIVYFGPTLQAVSSGNVNVEISSTAPTTQALAVSQGLNYYIVWTNGNPLVDGEVFDTLTLQGDFDPNPASNTGSAFKLAGIKFFTFEQGFDVRLTTNVQLQDQDGDQVSDSFLTTFKASASVSQGPIAVDLAANGIEYLESSADHQFFGPGLASAWVGPEDALLVYDHNGDGVIADAKELVLTLAGDDPSVSTDLGALATYFDTNRDGRFDALDDEWSLFGLWQDLNSDGIQQDGEFHGLDHWGVTSISLGYDADSSAYTAASGAVYVYGQTTVTYLDRPSTVAEDVAIAVTTTGDSEPLTCDGLPPMVDSYPSDAMDPSFSIDTLVSTYLETVAASGDSDADGNLSPAELAYGLDEMVTSFIETHGLSFDDHAAIQQDVINTLAHELNDLQGGDGLSDGVLDIAMDAAGDASSADVLAALDHHFQEIYDAHIVSHDAYQDPGSYS
jgi:hypothetical protein